MQSLSFSQDLPHPWLITEDSHINLVGVFSHFHKFIQPGDYLVCEDTNPLLARELGYGLFKDVTYDPVGSSFKYETFKEFMKDHGKHYRVDTGYTDLYG